MRYGQGKIEQVFWRARQESPARYRLARLAYRTAVLASVDDADLPSDSYQLFERSARESSTKSLVCLHEGG